MAAGTFTLVQSGKKGIGNGNIDLVNHALKCAFLGKSASLSITSTVSLYSQLSAHEIATSGYASGGILMTTKQYTETGNNVIKFMVDNFTVSGTGMKKVKYGLLYDLSSSAVNKIIGYWDMETTSETGIEATQITVSFPSNVVFQAS